VALAGLAALQASPASATGLADYRAVYDLIQADDDSGGGDFVRGRFVIEFKGSPCAGYSDTERLLMRATGDDGRQKMTDVRSSQVEKDGALTFSDETLNEDGSKDGTRGQATRTAAGLHVRLEPDGKDMTFGPDVVLPAEQLHRILDAARAGQRFLSFDIFDGSPDGQTIFSTSTVIGEESTAADDLGSETSVAAAGFAGLRHWPVTVSYFEKVANVDNSPDFETRFVLYENGVRRSLVLAYAGGLKLNGQLTRLEVLPEAPCAH
jgi:hypothetical protein